MTILCDRDLRRMVVGGLVTLDAALIGESDPIHLINPASIDIRVGTSLLFNTPQGFVEEKLTTRGPGV